MSVFDNDLIYIYEIRPHVGNNNFFFFGNFVHFDNVHFSKILKIFLDLATIFRQNVGGPSESLSHPRAV